MEMSWDKSKCRKLDCPGLYFDEETDELHADLEEFCLAMGWEHNPLTEKIASDLITKAVQEMFPVLTVYKSGEENYG